MFLLRQAPDELRLLPPHQPLVRTGGHRSVARVHVRCDGTRLDTILDLPESGLRDLEKKLTTTRADTGAPSLKRTRTACRLRLLSSA